jgi:precorrin-6A/cobalt-precorrin-6A reductase
MSRCSTAAARFSPMSAPESRPCRVLLLGGTGEAAELARLALQRFAPRLALITSLAGRTARPMAIPGEVRIGGFGGAEGLADYLRGQAIDALIDATHPFAEQISRHARLACEAAGVPRLMLLRPPWRRHDLDRWVEVEDLAGAAGVVGKLGRRAWLTVGAGDLAAFADIVDVRFLVRLIDQPRHRLALRFHEIVLGRGPFTVAEERHIIERHAIDVLVCKASGGSATEAKLIAAREMSLPVVMVRRPPREAGEAVESLADALSWLERMMERTWEAGG